MTKTAKHLVLHRTSQMYLPYSLENYVVDKIHFFDKSGIRWTIPQGWFRYREGDNGGWTTMYSDNPLTLDLDIEYTKKLKTDFDAVIAFFISTGKRDTWHNAIKIELYLPIEAYEWQRYLNATYHQEPTKQRMFDVLIMEKRKKGTVHNGIERVCIGVGLDVESGERPITEEMAKEQRANERIQSLEEPLKSVVAGYVQKAKNYRTTEKALKAEKAELEKKLKEVDEKLANNHFPSWVDELLEPIGREMLKEPELQGYDTIEIYGPFGIPANTHMYFKKGKGSITDKAMESISLDVVPEELDTAELRIRDYTIDNGKFIHGSTGEMNDMNHPIVDFPTSIRGLIGFLMYKKKKNDEEKQRIAKEQAEKTA